MIELTKCDICATTITNGTSIDIMMCRTLFDEDGEVHKTMEDVSDITDWDYLVACESCRDDVKKAWNLFLQQFGI